ncbi:MAG: TetR/AcrR family transcriptional regulator [Betaproteobacteria bacterium]|nr:TetR/AcrR family transcriptional regulator [Betaproteobacteria bacterium]
MHSKSETPGTRQRLVLATLELLQRQGLHGFGVSEVLARAEAPKGVLYHHFPGGKVELAIAAIETAVAQLLHGLQVVQAAGTDPVAALRHWLDRAHQRLVKSGFDLGCPLAGVALESTAADQQLREALARGFAAIRDELAKTFALAGLTRPRARKFATLVISAYEGALLQARIAGELKPANDTVDLLLEMLQGEIDATRSRT